MSFDVSLLENHPQLKLFYEFEELLFNISEDNVEQIEKKIDEFPKESYNCLRMYLSVCCSKFPFKLQLLERLWCHMGTIHHHHMWSSLLVEYLAKKNIIKPYLVPQYANPQLSWEDMLNVFPSNSIGHVIKNDDLEKFAIRSDESGFYKQTLLIPNERNDIPLLGFAGFCRSVNIFKFILINDQTEWMKYKKEIADNVIKGGSEEIVEICMQYNFPFSSQSLTTALYAHNNEIAQWILNNYGYGDFGMIDMIQTFNVLAIAFAMENSFNLAKLDNDNLTPLISASLIGYSYVVEWLLEKHPTEVDINARERVGLSALNYAAFGGHLDIIDYLIDKGADVNSKTNDNITPLLTACIMGHEKCVESLVVKGHSSLKQTEEHYTPLIFAAQNGNAEVVEYLLSLEPKLDINETGIEGKSPLHHAASHNYFSLVKLLVDNGANVNLADDLKETPLMASLFNFETDDAEFLEEEQEEEEDFNDEEENKNNEEEDKEKDENPNYDIHIPEETILAPSSTLPHTKKVDDYLEETLQVVSYLLDHGSDMYLCDENGETALDIALSCNSIEILQLFIDHGYDINHHNEVGATPLHIAINKSWMVAVKLFVEKGADINSPDGDGDTPLHVATLLESTRFAAYLIEHGASVNAENNLHVRPLNLAKRNDNEKMMRLLESRGATISENAIDDEIIEEEEEDQ